MKKTKMTRMTLTKYEIYKNAIRDIYLEFMGDPDNFRGSGGGDDECQRLFQRLMDSIRSGDIDSAREILKYKKCNFHRLKDMKNGNSILHFACRADTIPTEKNHRGHPAAIVHSLLKYGFNPNVENGIGATPLHFLAIEDSDKHEFIESTDRIFMLIHLVDFGGDVSKIMKVPSGRLSGDWNVVEMYIYSYFYKELEYILKENAKNSRKAFDVAIKNKYKKDLDFDKKIQNLMDKYL